MSERFRLRFEDAGIDDMMEEETDIVADGTDTALQDKGPDDEVVVIESLPESIPAAENQMNNGTIRTLDGELAGDELEGDAINYQILLGKIDALLDRLKLDA